MRELVVASCLTFDGVMEAPGGGDHPHAGWTFTDVPYDEEAYEVKEREQRECGGAADGSRHVRGVRPGVAHDGGLTSYNEGPKHVVSTTLEGDTAHWGRTTR